MTCIICEEDAFVVFGFSFAGWLGGWCLFFALFTLRLAILRWVFVGGLDSVGGRFFADLATWLLAQGVYLSVVAVVLLHDQ